MLRIRSSAVLSTLVASWCAVQTVCAQPLIGEDAPTMESEIKKLVPSLAAEIEKQIDRKGSGQDDAPPFRIAVFPFGDDKGRITLENSEQTFQVQGALNRQIIAEMTARRPKRFRMLDKFALAREFADGGVDPASVSPDNPELEAIVKRLNLDAALVGSVASDPQNENFMPKVKAKLVFADAGTPRTDAQINVPTPFNDGLHANLYEKRLRVELLLRERDGLRPIPIVTTSREDSPYHSMLFAIVPENRKNAEFVVRMSNRGIAGQRMLLGLVNPDRQKEQSRLYGVVVTIDGVNSIYEDLGDGTRGPLVVHPRSARKWMLSAPGDRIVRAENKSGYVLQRTQGPGNSIVDVVGFQESSKSARQFVFGRPSQSLAAEKVGVSDEIGVIAAYFFAQKIAGDQYSTGMDNRPPGDLGSRAGRAVAKPVFRVKVPFHKEPAHVVKILYRTSANCPIPERERISIYSGR